MAVVLKLNPTANTCYMEYFLGGAQMMMRLMCWPWVIIIILYVAGGTASNDLRQFHASGVISSTNAGGDCDGFVVEIN